MTDLRRTTRRKQVANYGIYEPPDPRDLAEYERIARSPQRWFGVAKNLHLSAQILWRQLRRRVFASKRELSPAAQRLVGLGPVFLMIAGLAMESAAKALVVGKFPKLVDGGRLRFITGHGIRRFLGMARVHLSGSDHEFLLRLEMYVTSLLSQLGSEDG